MMTVILNSRLLQSPRSSAVGWTAPKRLWTGLLGLDSYIRPLGDLLAWILELDCTKDFLDWTYRPGFLNWTTQKISWTGPLGLDSWTGPLGLDSLSQREMCN